MLQLSAALANRPVMSLRTGSEVAVAIMPIIDPRNLKIEGWYCHDSLDRKKQLILLNQDVRDIIRQGIVVNDHDVLAEPEEIVRLHSLLEMQFNLLGKQVVTVDKERLGKVTDYAADMPSLYIQKLYLSQPLLKSLSGGSLSVDRTQIIEITPKHIVIQNPLQPKKVRHTIATTPLPT
jgi:uncharacterized protein YrrD